MTTTMTIIGEFRYAEVAFQGGQHHHMFLGTGHRAGVPQVLQPDVLLGVNYY